MANGVNANMLRRWVADAARGGPPVAGNPPGFVTDQLPTTPASPVQPTSTSSSRGATTIAMRWPAPRRRLRDLAARDAALIRIDAMWLAAEPVDMRAGADRLIARVVEVFGAAQAHHGYLFANARGTRMKLLVHDGFGVWCAARRLNQGRFVWPDTTTGALHRQLTRRSSTRWCWACRGSA